MKKLVAALCLLVFFPVLVLGAAMESGASTADAAALDDIPPEYQRFYVEAASRFAFEWQLLAAVGKVECDHGRGACYRPNRAGAMGPMQFLAGTWARYRDASGESPYDVYDARDSIFAAAAKLSADGIKDDIRAALLSYNHSHAYTDDVLSWAVRYGWVGGKGDSLAAAVLSHPNIELRPEARADVEAGIVDRRVLGALLVLATEHRLAYVGPFVTGHSIYVAGTDRISNHAVGRAVDIPIVDGVPVSATNSAARDAARLLLSLPPAIRPHELGSPWVLDEPGAFSDSRHRHHLHFGVGENP